MYSFPQKITKLRATTTGNILRRAFCNQNSKKPIDKTKSNDLRSKLHIGQPTYETHSHLFRTSDEVTSLIEKREYEDRRRILVNSLVNHCRKEAADVKRHLVIIPSTVKQYMSDRIPYFFRQNTEFLYLTGCQEPDSCLVLVSEDSGTYCSTLFVRNEDPHSELWDGPRTRTDSAVKFFGVHQSLPMGELENYLNAFLKNNSKSRLWYDYGEPVQESVHKLVNKYLGAQKHGAKLWESPKTFIHQQRLIKSPNEIELMRKTCDIASDAIIEAIRTSKPGSSEHEIFAKVDYESRIRGAEYLAYPPVVAGGARANIIHYINNNQVVNDGEMVLMDAGCEYHGYASDITRTWPISGRFSGPQRELYEIVLNSQLELIEHCKDFPSLDKLFSIMCESLGKQLQELGLITRQAQGQNLVRAAYEFCPHHVSHYLGMDVHDTPTITRSRPIEPGMIITMEPGVYVSDKNKQINAKYHGIGIRIEDDILITQNGPIVLTQKCPKNVNDIEKIAMENQ